MRTDLSLLAQVISDPTAPPERIILPKRDPVAAANYSELEERQRSLDRFASELTSGGKPPHALDFPVRDLIPHFPPIKWYIWPPDLYIPGNADFKNYWFSPCPDDHRYSRQWVLNSYGPGMVPGAIEADAGNGRAAAFTAVNPYTPHARCEAGIGFVYTPSIGLHLGLGGHLAQYRVTATLRVHGQYRWNIQSSYFGAIEIYELGVIYIAAWRINPGDGSLELVKPYGVTTVFNIYDSGQGETPITDVFPSWSPGPLSANLPLEGGQSYVIGVIAAVDVTNKWPVPPGKWPEIGSEEPQPVWNTWCSLNLEEVPKITIDQIT
jgi:hypothetical protein